MDCQEKAAKNSILKNKNIKIYFFKLLKEMKEKNILKNSRLLHGIAFIPHGLLFTMGS